MPKQAPAHDLVFDLDGLETSPGPASVLGERRMLRRVEADLALEIPLARNVGYQVRTHDISRTGLSFRLPCPIDLPRTAALSLTLPDGQTVTLHSEMQRARRVEGSSEVEVGARFKTVSPDTDLALLAAMTS